MAEKRSRTDELLEALMLRMDAMDQAIASLKALLPGREHHLARRSPQLRRGCGDRGRAKVLGGGGQTTPAQVGNGRNLDSTQPEDSASLVVDAGHAESWAQSQVAAQTVGFVIPTTNTVASKDTGRPVSGILWAI
ncbi:hypothetical protein NDU88_004064 [Pleurodeles waltl]|uniref:Uncharacterized protein n=1 Tax=Pleurodeles waltl TaxID=8319 RepID=A0AAV7W7Y3_PLEWA|nr:hypothetical protein NDU88_004064 [Pleurodeles waltl]